MPVMKSLFSNSVRNSRVLPDILHIPNHFSSLSLIFSYFISSNVSNECYACGRSYEMLSPPGCSLVRPPRRDQCTSSGPSGIHILGTIRPTETLKAPFCSHFFPLFCVHHHKYSLAAVLPPKNSKLSCDTLELPPNPRLNDSSDSSGLYSPLSGLPSLKYLAYIRDPVYLA